MFSRIVNCFKVKCRYPSAYLDEPKPTRLGWARFVVKTKHDEELGAGDTPGEAWTDAERFTRYH